VARFATTAAFAALAWTGSASAQIAPPAPETIAVGDWQLAPVVELRGRGEYRRDLDDRNRGLLLARARIGLGALRGPLEARVVLQDARAVDLAETDFVGGPAPIGIVGAYQAWGEAHTASGHPSFVRFGRQPITWGEGRLLGAADWSPAGRSLDAVRGRLVVGDGAFELLAAALTDATGGASLRAYGELVGARAEWAFDPLLGLDVYALGRLAQAEPQVSPDSSVLGQTYTGAARLHGDGHDWNWGAEAVYQLGNADELSLNVPAGTSVTPPRSAHRAAWAAAGHVAYNFERTLLQPTAGLGASYASGDDGGSTYRAFDPLLPEVHLWHGAMDLFAWSNQEEASARVTIVPWADAVAAVEYRYVRLAQPGGAWRTAYLTTIGSAPGNTNADLGHEVDAVLTWSPWVPVELMLGYSLLALGEGARAILSANQIGVPQPGGALAGPAVSHFAYGQMTLRVP
jgi:hypothetical protein